jgi:hypothetical protein
MDVFTPADISATQVQRDDRPYAGYWYTGQFLHSDLPDRGASLRAAVHMGVIGPLAAAGQAQTAIHRLMDCELPAGWGHQIGTDLVVDYQLQFRKRLFAVGRVLEAGSLAEARAGSLYNQLRIGSTLRFGKWQLLKGSASRPGKGFRCFGSWQGVMTGVGYNATLQGGLLNRYSRYTLGPERINRLVWGQMAGVFIGWGKFTISFGQTWLSREFQGGKVHCWNYLSIWVRER